jgi:hypothetical protein
MRRTGRKGARTGRADRADRPDSRPAPDVTVPVGASEARALDALKAQGFTASFVAGRPGTLRVLGRDRDFFPHELTIRAHQRFEGVSDPDDMSIVYAIESADGTKGTLVDAFGVYANPAITAVIDEVLARSRA